MGAELDLLWNKVFQEDKNHQREESNQLAAGGQLIGAPLCPLTDTLTLMANAKLIFGVAAKLSLDDFSPPRCEAAHSQQTQELHACHVFLCLIVCAS